MGPSDWCRMPLIPLIILGLLFLVGAIALGIGHKGWSWGTIAAAWLVLLTSVGAFFLVGMVMMWFSASFVVIVAIVHRLSVAGMPLQDNVVVLVISILITALPALIPFTTALVGGDGAREKLERLGRWTTINGRYILGVMMLVLGTQDLLVAFGH
jgi:hypothetical protein